MLLFLIVLVLVVFIASRVLSDSLLRRRLWHLIQLRRWERRQ
jgi:hypothetical protein